MGGHEAELREDMPVAAAGGDQHADDRHGDAERLQAADRRAEGQESADEHEDRDSALENADIDRRGRIRRDIHQRVEGGEAEGAEQRHLEPVRLERRPVLAQALPEHVGHERTHEDPAQRSQRHRRDLADGEPAGDGVAGPEQRGQREQQVGVGPEPLRDGGRLLQNACPE
jgi:hypothetical protein